MEEHRDQAGKPDVLVGEEGISGVARDARSGLESAAGQNTNLAAAQRVTRRELARDGGTLVEELEILSPVLPEERSGVDPDDQECDDREDPSGVQVANGEQGAVLSRRRVIMGPMDTTTGAEQPTADGRHAHDVAALIDSLQAVDSAAAPEVATEIARLLTDELDRVSGDARAEQLVAFDGASEPED